jgi:LmbE family N-acetylglucosaminyl deacetylase
MINLKECITATRILGIKDVFSFNWRNDYMDSTPLQELRAQIILLIRKYRPDVVLGHDPWAHYDRNPDHRKVARALADAFWLAGYANVHPEHLALGLKPHRVPYLFLKARVDYGRGHEANVAMEINAEQVRRKQKAYVAHRNVYANPAAAARMRKLLQAENLVVDAIEDQTDQAAAILFDEWHMEWISRKRGAENGLPYAEIYWRIEEFDHLPGLKDYVADNAVPR